MKFLLYFVFAIFCFSSCSYLNKKIGLNDDNILEEIIEEQIQKRTGVNIDLTPASAEEIRWNVVSLTF